MDWRAQPAPFIYESLATELRRYVATQLMFRRVTADSIERRPWGLVVLGVAALAGLYYSLSGYAMAGSFAISNPEQLSHWQCVAAVYLACAGISGR
jgi:hypothetical protein